MTVGAVVLAAGGGSRFTAPTHKLLAPLGRSTVVGRVLAEVLAAGIGPVAVVTGAVEIPVPAEVERIVNDRWAEGQSTSLQAAVAWAAAQGLDAVVVGLGDQPGITAADWAAVAAASATPIATATFATATPSRARRPPVRLARAAWPLLPATGDRGAGALIAARPDLVTEVPCAGDPTDIDTVEDLARWGR